jgi:deoxyribonuclease-4
VSAHPILGAHVSTGGGLAGALGTGAEIGAQAIQIFTRNQVQWKGRPVSEEEARGFRAARTGSGIEVVLSHGSYLLNLASPKKALLQKSRAAFGDELHRCEALGIDYLVFHPGAHMGEGVETGLGILVESLGRALAALPQGKVMPLLENTAGQGSYLGSRFEELRHVLDRVDGGRRLGVCLDTCHLLAAGYDIATPEGYAETLRSFGEVVGFDRLRAVHLNDAKAGLGSRLDRHESIGEGELGLPFFKRLLADTRLRHVPMVLETPGAPEDWRREIALLRKMA